MTLPERIARCELEIQQCWESAAAADNDLDRYGLTWAEVDWLVAKQFYENELAATDKREGEDGFHIGC